MIRSRYLISPVQAPRARRAVDVTTLVLGLVVAIWSWRRYLDLEDPAQALADFLAQFPSWLGGTFSFLYAFCALYALAILFGLAVQFRSRFDALRDAVLALLLTSLVAVLVVRQVSGEWPRVIPELGLAEPISQYPIFRVAMVTALLRSVEPHLTRPLRRFGVFVITLAGIAGVGSGFGLPASAIGAVGIGFSAAAAILLIFGSPRGYPDLDSVARVLSGFGVTEPNLSLDQNQSWGVRKLVGDSPAGPIEVKVYGRDATDSQTAARMWRYAWYRDSEASFALTRSQAVEHEALVTMMAARATNSVVHVLAAGEGEDSMAILATSGRGTRLSEVDPTTISDRQLVDIWESVSVIHAAGISHGSLTTSAISVEGDRHWLNDFGSGSLGASDTKLALDVVELLFSLALVFGADRAVDTAAAGLGMEALAGVLPYIQVPAVASKSRRDADKPKLTILQLQAKVEEVTSSEAEETVQLRRVQLRNVVMTGLTVFAAYFLISQMSGIDFNSVWEVVSAARWDLIVIAFVIGQTVYLPEATGMLAAVGRDMPLKPVMILQSAIKFISLAVPSSAGRIGMTATFLRKYGVSFTASLVQGSIDTISGLMIEISTLIIAVVFGDLNFGITSGDPEWLPFLLIVVVVGIGVVALVTRIQRLRDWVMPVVGEAWGALRGVLSEPKRAFVLMISSFSSRFILAVSMWVILQSMGVSVGIWSVFAATTLTGLLAGVIPIPGGVGVSEAVLTATLVIFGVDETVAFAAAVVYRFATFYIPSAYGWFSMQWLDRNGYI